MPSVPMPCPNWLCQPPTAGAFRDKPAYLPDARDALWNYAEALWVPPPPDGQLFWQTHLADGLWVGALVYLGCFWGKGGGYVFKDAANDWIIVNEVTILFFKDFHPMDHRKKVPASLTAVRTGFAVTFPGFGGFRESTSVLGTDAGGLGNEIGRASCRERVCLYV